MPHARADAGEPALIEELRARIRRDGPIPVDQFMRACLAHPRHGYWQRAGSIGAGGDFITAPEISQVFGELVGLWCAVVWQGMGRPAPLRLVELGPGRGALMRDALRAARAVPAFLDAVAVHLVEVSGPLREVQRQALSPPLAPPRKGEGNPVAIAWHDTLAQVAGGPAIVVANEFLDALPIRQLVFLDGTWRERVVDVDAQGALLFAAGPEVEVADDAAAGSPPPGAILEFRAGEDELIGELARRRAPHVALFIDYGPAELAYGDTLQAVRRHAYVDPLGSPGTADLTAHVQFARLADKARAAGLAAYGPITQAEFLGRLGIVERAARLMAANPAQASDIEAGVQRLLSPTGMGQLFKVLAVCTNGLPPPPPFV
jgi:SAM-dependent MidA family methyltransferase